MATCRARRSYSKPYDDPENVCGEPIAGWTLSIRPREVDQLLAASDEAIVDVDPVPVGYCEAHLRTYEEARAGVRARGDSAGIIPAGGAWGVVRIEKAVSASAPTP